MSFISIKNPQGTDIKGVQQQGSLVVSVTANAAHTGRRARETTVIINAPKINKAISKRVVQNSPGSIIKWDQNKITVPNTGGLVTISGRANVEGLSLQVTGDIELLDVPYYVNNQTKPENSGENIYGDPGATSAYPFAVKLNLDPNIDTLTRTAYLTATSVVDSTKSSICTIEVSAASEYLTVDAGDETADVTLGADAGSTATIIIDSNVSWTIEME